MGGEGVFVYICIYRDNIRATCTREFQLRCILSVRCIVYVWETNSVVYEIIRISGIFGPLCYLNIFKLLGYWFVEELLISSYTEVYWK